MRTGKLMSRLAIAGLALAAAQGAAAATHFYVPFSLQLGSGGYKGLWLADTANLGNPPYQITNQVLDGPTGIAVLDDWTYNAVNRTGTNVTPQLAVYGQGGHFYKVNLKAIQPVAQFSSGSYQELCSLTPLDERPFAAAKAYVQAVVEPVGSPNTCSSGVGTQTWLIPASADNTVAPTIEPANWSVLGAFTDPTDDSFVRWIVWTGNELDAYKANFSSHTTLLVDPPAGPAPFLIARLDGTAFIQAPSDDGTTHTDRFYRVTMGGASLLGTYSFADSSPCNGTALGSMLDSSAGNVSFLLTTNAGYAVYNVPLSGGTPTQIYADNTGLECGSLAGDAPAGGHLGLDEVDMSTGLQHVITLSEAGPVSQTPAFVAGGANQNAFLRYTIDGRFWIDVRDFSSSPVQYSEVVANGDGSIAASYSNSRIGDDMWGAFTPNGATPSIQRDVVYLFSPNATPCTGGTLTAMDPAALTGTNISGVPSDACTALGYGWAPASVGYVQEAGGSAPVEIDPVGGKLYFLLGPDPDGAFVNATLLFTYPFL